ncbi:threonine synthase [Pseudodonghicola flavimaris]|uniref:Threonine synthase n=1 Tax=Pseudodonghicola flavimaris TaxID=3050036 RepID=A0ABT7F5A1_9RHOB|nr:threonine synthase [Pseudodonghicola flavimaris]MDK3019795.1 threonine synthase [Pseudodonghicola flavimaris]
MQYISTRGQAPAVDFKTAILTGLAPDGGLYLPADWPRFTAAELSALRGASYTDVAFEVIRRFAGDSIAPEQLRTLLAEAYDDFGHPAVAPLVQTGPRQWVLELFHGPTLAFKDFAMQAIAPLMAHFLAQEGREMTIVGATSGDTGGAALRAFAGRAGIRVLFLFPRGGVSPFQQEQMLELCSETTHVAAVEGNFDDCQRIVKALFADEAFREAVSLSAVNSINWGRIVAQSVYYITTCLALGLPETGVNFVVPSGNFGDIYAGYVARRMGAPIAGLTIATNENDILARVHATGRYAPTALTPTITPAMDIQVASNFERLLFDLLERDPAALCQLMAGLDRQGGFTLPEAALARFRAGFGAEAVGQQACRDRIAATHSATRYVADPHTAVALEAAARTPAGRAPQVVLSTAHPVKFNETVTEVLGFCPGPGQAPFAPRAAGARPEEIANDIEAVKARVRALL